MKELDLLLYATQPMIVFSWINTLSKTLPVKHICLIDEYQNYANRISERCKKLIEKETDTKVKNEIILKTKKCLFLWPQKHLPKDVSLN